MNKINVFFVCIILLYIYIYSPAFQFFPYFGLDKIVTIIAGLYILYSSRIKQYIKTFNSELLLLVAIVGMSFVVNMLHGKPSGGSLLMYDSFLLLECLLVPFAFMLFIQKHFSGKIELIILFISTFAGLISVFLLLNPSVADIVKTRLLRIQEIITTNFYFRGFGLSDNLLFAYPVVQGFTAAIIICKLYRGAYLWHYILLLPILVSIFVNARSGIIPILIAGLIVLINSAIVAKIKYIFATVFVLYTGLFLLNNSSNSQLMESMEWGLNVFQLIGDMLSGKQIENMDALTDTMVFFPQDLASFLFGTGYNIFSDYPHGYGHSDIGYCIRMVYGGIFYVGLWMILLVKMFLRLRKVNRNMAILLFVSLLYMNWKSDFFVVTPASRFFFLLYAFCLLDSRCFKKDETQTNSVIYIK